MAEAKAMWRKERRVYRPWAPLVGEHLVIDWGSEGGSQQFCAVLAWSRYRFVRFAADQQPDLGAANAAARAWCGGERAGAQRDRRRAG